MKLSALLVGFVLPLAACWGDNNKRLAILRNEAAERAVCVTEHINEPQDAILEKCFKQVTGDDLRDAINLIIGMKAGVVKSGVTTPGAVYGADAGAK
jgi:hypothetical protein